MREYSVPFVLAQASSLVYRSYAIFRAQSSPATRLGRGDRASEREENKFQKDIRIHGKEGRERAGSLPRITRSTELIARRIKGPAEAGLA